MVTYVECASASCLGPVASVLFCSVYTYIGLVYLFLINWVLIQVLNASYVNVVLVRHTSIIITRKKVFFFFLCFEMRARRIYRSLSEVMTEMTSRVFYSP